MNAAAARRLILGALLSLAPGGSFAYETDQFSGRLNPIQDATWAFDQQVNASIAKAVVHWRGPRDDMKVVNRIYNDIGGRHWVDRIERWAMQAEDVERLTPDRRDSIYSGHPFWATRVAGLFGVGPTIKINDTLVGSDKLGHFLSQGRKFYRRYLRYEDEARAAEHSAYTERALFGQATTGVYSNADLVANYEGYRFYRSLFEDDIIAGKPAILSWQDDHWKIQRTFTWADHINAYWDEALNINHYDALLYPHMKVRIIDFCPDYHAAPELFQVENEASLKEKYADLQLRDSSELRLDNLCAEPAVSGSASKVAVSSN